MLTPITKRQKQILDFVHSYTKKREYAPSLEDIKKHFDLSSVATVHQHVDALKRKGYLKKTANQPRAIEAYKKKPRENVVQIPLLGTIAAGAPIEAIEDPETITVAKEMLTNPGRHFALRVKGNSMIDEGIFDGDTVIIREQPTAENGETVVAIVNENEATLKRLFREKNKIRLQPANQTLLPLYFDEVEIRGKVISVIRNYSRGKEEPLSLLPRKLERRIDYSWDFNGAHTKTFTHGLHPYPAMFIPQVANRLLKSYSNEGDTICDIFCGSGTALVESRLLNRNAYGIDLNPFAVLLAKAKTTEIDPKLLQKEYIKLLDTFGSLNTKTIPQPKFFNIEFWFKSEVIKKLARLKYAIFETKNTAIRNFFLTSFSEVVRLSSNTKNNEFKLVRMPTDELSKHNPDVFGMFKQKTEKNIARMSEFSQVVNKKTWAKVVHGNSADRNVIENESIDCIITSPPYGDSRTTVAYGQFSRLASQWLGIVDDNQQVDNLLLGGKRTNGLTHHLNSEHLDEAIEKVAKQDEQRARDVLSFYIDLEKCLKNAYRILKKGKYFCLVVGNRTVKQIQLPTDFIIAELGDTIGFDLIDLFVRNIPNKRMPLKNSPTNVVGKLESTMCKESIVILKKV
ncbi:MAG: hypothetical protein COV74_04940 [Candidatus Omnitrophica bacterium CG11_big_fil_rev_8_21_14_0_20_45_26]|uniref:LexA repressor n=1 Tax=Candidatus Abzuiibacterium crystallinum TaxID=1974748 RepID=A0A2H0LPW2_9BACT|nr:MAG: hypothetical protein COV74_04940 [Candidatus Omnitrophica bacterium CG11_big_fil_rev_8_21_14_0_20_45_26]PIW63607.1 MAG: hypothetical protein COW12_09855 [Candidatus Omnitrophica bacterium CG12_big_fil_rev_8_21_14_0_65_45_16]